MKLNPIKTYKDITNSYLNYLKTLFYSKNDSINKTLSKLITSERFVKGPYLEQIFEFEVGQNVSYYIQKGVLHQDLEKILKNYEKNNLYFHQEQVIIKTIKENKNVILSTGTGSGKTLSFLIPVIDYILKNPSKGVKALFLYPMNALANDQLKDLRNRLKNLPKVTFGRYTGDTKYKESEAVEEYQIKGIEILENERKSREEILSNPPDILITNYAMLEFLMIRPQDSVLFEDKTWRFIILDEIHTYDGAKGTEIGYLIRKLKDKVFDENNQPICIGASATLGDEENNQDIAKFAENIFGEKFYPDSIIRAKYKKPKIYKNNLWKLNFDIIAFAKDFEDNNEPKKTAKNYNKNFETKESEKYAILYDFLKNNYEINKLKEILLNKSYTIQEISKVLKLTEDEIVTLIELSLKAKKGDKELLKAKYHFFLKASEGLYGVLNTNGEFEEIFFEKKLTHNGKKVFELASCSNCGEIFITGIKKKQKLIEIDEGDENDILNISSKKRVFLYPIKDISEEEIFEIKNKNNGLKFLNIENGILSTSSNSNNSIPVIDLKLDDESFSIKECPKCEKIYHKNLPSITYRFVTGEEVPQFVILTELYQHLPENNKKILVFSDSRRDAAFFTIFFDKNYKEAINRKKIMSILKEKNILNSKVLIKILNSKYPYGKKGESEIDYISLLIKEFTLRDPKSLENIGLIKFILNSNQEQKVLNCLNFLSQEYSLSPNEIKSLLYILLLSIRESFAIEAETNIGEALDLPFSSAPSFKLNSDGNVKGWIGRNKRVDFIKKTFNVDNKKANQILKEIWKNLTSHTEIFDNENGKKRLKMFEWDIKLNDEIYRCNTCRKIQIWNFKNKCSIFKCNGILEKININNIGESKYYIELYTKNNDRKTILKLHNTKIEEHTAQLDRNLGEKYQVDFEKGKINILSCSTTFELGVDIGSLQSVFLHNIPPKPDNYIQRAGRAGRSIDSIAFVVSYANRKAHDLKYFENPEILISGKIKTPVITIENIRIIRRHLNSIALGLFLKQHFAGYRNITLNKFLEIEGFKKFKEFINSRPEKLKKSIKNILNDTLIKELEVDNWGWIRDNKEKNEKYEGCLDLWEKIEMEIKNDIEEYKKLEKKFADERKYTEANEIKKILNYIESLDIISLFSRKIFIPKYGFPVDTISLDTTRILPNSNLSLDRDMSIALREFTPGEKIIANKKLIISGNIKIIKDKMPTIIKYYFCRKCGYYREGIDLNFEKICPNCQNKIRKPDTGKYITPIFGFEANKCLNNVPSRKPIPKSRIRKFFIGDENILEEKFFKNIKLKLAKRGKITVLNIDYMIKSDNNKDLNNLRLGYNFYTDVLSIQNISFTNNNKLEEVYSLMYALLEGASSALDIKREDIDATLFPRQETYDIILFDNVPAGAGFMKAIYNKFNFILEEAFNIVNNCKCDEDTCCPLCLEHVSNQFITNFIKRKRAKDLLIKILNKNRIGGFKIYNLN